MRLNMPSLTDEAVAYVGARGAEQFAQRAVADALVVERLGFRHVELDSPILLPPVLGREFTDPPSAQLDLADRRLTQAKLGRDLSLFPTGGEHRINLSDLLGRELRASPIARVNGASDEAAVLGAIAEVVIPTVDIDAFDPATCERPIDERSSTGKPFVADTNASVAIVSKLSLRGPTSVATASEHIDVDIDERVTWHGLNITSRDLLRQGARQ